MPTDRADAAAAAVDADEVLATAQALIRARSENPGSTEDEAADVATAVLRQLGAAPETVRGEAGRPSVVATIGGDAGPTFAWNGHLDTVPAGSLDTWSVDPFAGEVVEGKLIGRGACDMKGPIAAALAGASAVVRAGVELAGSLTFHLVADEELAGTHGTQVLRDRGLLTQDAAIVGEPSDLQLALAERGGAWVTATTYGAAAHGSQPERGVNAITSMARFLLRLPEVVPDTVHPLCGRATVNAALIEGGSAPNMVPDRCVVDIDRRTLPGEIGPREGAGAVPRARRGPAGRAPGVRPPHGDPRLDLGGRVARRTRHRVGDPHGGGRPRPARRRPTSGSPASPTPASI